MKLEEMNKIIAKNIEKSLIDKDMSKTDLARKLDIQEKSVSFIFRKLKNGKNVNNATLCKWADVIGVDVGDFFCNLT
ncbi:Predicted transcriptional regulator [Sebaldella termitidis]|uniref:HTH cro/C1-type domain-containing protein n=1 Tax=Sebaldella termitidis (strain ATCC 33386 / NCTC 11300) TaxID=526218 RepID=D1AR08_SEBTE|nr:helix-turn-helix transcriptional regulator [Sebaldella termitidis]ACZ07696.1 hypothetical protein Sterm_0824 [Sebaldella termitidis ATCC 33386]SUI22992.1 Predicted transcriptional regulator [Sebaldella termitidis]